MQNINVNNSSKSEAVLEGDRGTGSKGIGRQGHRGNRGTRPPLSQMFLSRKIISQVKFMPADAAATTTTGVPYVFPPREKLPPPRMKSGCGEALLVTFINATHLLEIYCFYFVWAATRNLLAIATLLLS